MALTKKNQSRILEGLKLFGVLALLLTLFMVLPACLKPIKEKKCNIPDQLCDSALLVLENKTLDTIYFNRDDYDNRNPYNRIIKPGETFTYKTGYVEVHFNGSCDPTGFMLTNIQTIGTPAMYFSIKMDRCTKHANFVKSYNTLDLQVE